VDDKLLTVDQVAAKLLVSTQTIHRWLRSGKLKGVRWGKEWRVSTAALKSFGNYE
jgi:excisionase family DNA binding protein